MAKKVREIFRNGVIDTRSLTVMFRTLFHTFLLCLNALINQPSALVSNSSAFANA